MRWNLMSYIWCQHDLAQLETLLPWPECENLPPFIRFHFHFSLENDREMAKIFLFSLPDQREIVKIFSFHFPNNGKNIFFSLFTSQVTGKVYFFSFHFPPNGIFFFFSLFPSRNGETISRWTLAWSPPSWPPPSPTGSSLSSSHKLLILQIHYILFTWYAYTWCYNCRCWAFKKSWLNLFSGIPMYQKASSLKTSGQGGLRFTFIPNKKLLALLKKNRHIYMCRLKSKCVLVCSNQQTDH